MAASVWKSREAELRRMAGNIPAEEIAKRWGITRGALSFGASRLGVSLACPEKRRRDCGGGRPRVWEKRRAEIETLAKTLTDTEIAAHYGCGLYPLRARCKAWGITLTRGQPVSAPLQVPWRIPEQI